jgi:type-F conjugative transfer system pilin assembly protein TrbC
LLRALKITLIAISVNFPVYAKAADSVGYQKMVDDAQNLSSQDKADYQGLINGVESKVKAEEVQAKELVQKVKRQVADQDLSQANDVSEEQIVSLTQMLKDHQSVSSYDLRQLEKGLFIFVSLSMPEVVLKNLDTLAELIGGRLILRGLKENSFKKTVEHIQYLQNQGIKVEINPQLFDLFKIILVPTFVLVDRSKADILQGNVGLLHVLKEFSLLGDNQELAKEYLLILEP